MIPLTIRLEFVLVLKSLGPLGGDVYLLNRACKGIGTHEDLLTEILMCRSNNEMFLLKEAFRRTYNKDLVQVVKGELSMKTERMFVMALAGTRDESTFVNHQQVQQDVEQLYRAGAGQVGTVSEKCQQPNSRTKSPSAVSFCSGPTRTCRR